MALAAETDKYSLIASIAVERSVMVIKLDLACADSIVACL